MTSRREVNGWETERTETLSVRMPRYVYMRMKSTMIAQDDVLTLVCSLHQLAAFIVDHDSSLTMLVSSSVYAITAILAATTAQFATAVPTKTDGSLAPRSFASGSTTCYCK